MSLNRLTEGLIRSAGVYFAGRPGPGTFGCWIGQGGESHAAD